MEYWLIGGLAYIAAGAWVFRTLRRGWIEQFGRFTRGDALSTLIVSMILPAGIAIVISEQPRVAEWFSRDA